MNRAFFNLSSYPICIKFDEIDVTSGCNAGCLYCSLAKNKEYSEKLSIKHLLTDNNPLPKGVYLSPNSDPFDKLASELTHELLSYYLPKGVSFLINTKNKIPDKTISLLAKYKNKVIPQISIARLDQDITDYLEPNTSSIIDRLETIAKLSKAGLPVRVLMIPLFPDTDDKPDVIERFIKEIKKTGAKALKASYVVLRDKKTMKDNSILRHILNHKTLSRSFDLMTENMKVHIGEGRIYPIDKRVKTYKLINKLCKENDIYFLTCTVLDPAMKKINSDDFISCRNVWTYQNKLLNRNVDEKRNLIYR